MSNSCRNCPVCDLTPAPEDLIVSLNANHHHPSHLRRQSYDLTYCACGELVYISPLPSDEEILAIYTETEQFSGCPYRGERAATVLEYITSCLFSLMRSMEIDLHAPLRVLEVGAGLSWMCRAAKMVDHRHLTVAQDIVAEAVAECRWVDHYLVEDILTGCGADPHGPYDVISLTHVFEHLADPVATLRRLRDLLAPRGIVFITASHRPPGWKRGADAAGWASWSYTHVPAHIQYFSEGSFAKAAAAAGLAVGRWDDGHDGGQAFEGWLRHA